MTGGGCFQRRPAITITCCLAYVLGRSSVNKLKKKKRKKTVVTQLPVSFVSLPSARQETRIRASEKDPQSKGQNICISNQYGGEEVTHTLTAEGREDTHRWMEAFWQHFYDMSKRTNTRVGRRRHAGAAVEQESDSPSPNTTAGQWRQCCDELMKIELPSPRKPAPVTPKQGSLYHEMGENLLI